MKPSYAFGSKRVNNEGTRRGLPNRSILRRCGAVRVGARSDSGGGRPAAATGRDVRVASAGVSA
jgi:hypothetical protein